MIRVELRKQTFRVRTYILLGLVICIPVLMTVAVELGRRPRNENNFFALASHSGLNVPLAALTASTSFLLVIVVSLFAGGAVADEAGWGSLRYLLLRPVSRGRLLFDKLIVVVVMAILATLFIAVSGLIAGTIAFGWHAVATPDGIEFGQGSALGKLALSTLYVAWCMSGIAALAFMISTMTDASLGAVISALGVSIVSQILDAISSLGSVRTLLITHYWHAWEGLFANPVTSSDMIKGVIVQLPYAAIFLVLAWWWFHRRDILC
ncbi:MAG: ABC transporter permease [Chloroflexi bacterium]|nr:MAG: ABC transporter permease [Chloroflexota bacterium]